jgi:protein involved in polysaccharide export with SLBB domain
MFQTGFTILYKRIIHTAFVITILTCSGAWTQPAVSTSTPWTLNSSDAIEVNLRFSDAVSDSFRIASGDMLSVVFVDHPELTIEQCVRSDGKIALPYTGDIHAAGSTPQALRSLLMARFSEELQNSQIVVVLKQGSSRAEELHALMDQNGGRSRQFIIRPDGCISLPAAGDIHLAGFTIAQADSLIIEAYRSQGIALNADVMLAQNLGAAICVIGAVNQPGRFTLDHSLSLPEAVALAGGYRNDATLKKIMIINTANKDARYKQYNLDQWFRGRNCSPLPSLCSGDIVYVPRRGLDQAAETVKRVGDIILLRGWTIGLGQFLIGY